MTELDFKLWLMKSGIPKKLCSDYVSRLKRIEKSIKNCDLDNEYRKDKCTSLLELFENSGKNKIMASLHIGDLPIGKYYLSTYKLALRKYIAFKILSH